MFKPCSKGCQHLLRVLIFVFAERKEASFQAKQVCEQVDVPEYFTRKVLQSLVKNGLLETRRGPNGGYTVAKGVGGLSVLDVIKSVDGKNTFDQCILGGTWHGDENPCPFHNSWVKVRLVLMEYLAKTHIGSREHETAGTGGTRNHRKDTPQK
ncbi:MAG: Rrf2 family transcriptional regulator [Candidatus Hydrogenedentes bacterium]|nr:Rrf2 family transcriptional regulator [Candidatus Hydrogenedentota bacterium]